MERIEKMDEEQPAVLKPGQETQDKDLVQRFDEFPEDMKSILIDYQT